MKKRGRFSGFIVLAMALLTTCSPFPPPSTGTITTLHFEVECFDLDTGLIFQSRSIAERCQDIGWDFVFAYNSTRKPHAVLFTNPQAQIKVAYSTADYNAIQLSDVLSAHFLATNQDRPIDTAIIQTDQKTYFKIHVLKEWLRGEIIFEWEKLK